ncbi:MAG: glycoside hydrolase family 140 protein, partial [Terracidiphilus sp.]
AAAAAHCLAGPLPRIVVHPDGHLLAGEDGSPFFWLGDTAWQLIQEASRVECSYYLRTRARQGFTVIQTVVLAEFGGVKEPTTTGLLPFAQMDPRRPNEAYFDRVAEIVDEAARLGLYVALVPTWGDKLTAPWGTGPRLFRNDNLDVAEGYGRYLAAKMRARSNVLWLLGGDRPPRLTGMNNDYLAKMGRDAGFPADQDWTPIWRALAAGIRTGLGAEPTILYHPQGGRESSSFFLHNEPWLKVNGMQSGHGGGHDVPVWEMIARDYALTPPKPTLDLEPNYEDHPYNPWPQWDPASGYFRDHDVRKQVYRSVLAGGCGVTYGHHSVWQFADSRHEVVNHADRDWIDAVQRPGGRQMVYLRLLLESRPYFRRIPDPGLIAAGQGAGGLHLEAARDRDGSYAFVYFPMNDQSATIDLGRLRAARIDAWWYDPRTGIGTPIGQVASGKLAEFRSPSYGPDWVLVLDDAAAGYPPPGLA